MRIKEISVKKLFGMFDYTIPLNLDEHITIIHGPNGYGKTNILKLIKASFSFDLEILHKIPFDKYDLIFDDSSVYSIKKKSENDPVEIPGFLFIYEKPGKQPLIYPGKNGSDKQLDFFPELLKHEFSIEMIEEIMPNLSRIGRERWIDDRSGRIISLSQIMKHYNFNLPMNKPEWLENIIESPPIYFIETQRLLIIPEEGTHRSRRINPRKTKVVEKYSEELSKKIEAKLAESAELSQKLDSTFPNRLLQLSNNEKLDERYLREELNNLEKRRRKLMDTGLLEKDEGVEIPMGDIDSAKKEVLSLYINDTEEKLSIFDEMSDKIELMKTIINNHFSYKEMSISKEKGFVFTDNNGNIINPSDLSSGEQHQLVLLYAMLFEVNPGSMILIDEPEISLHVAWQKDFIRDLQRIAKMVNLDFLIATHSPQIINERWKLTVELKGVGE
ncbi:MAG: AAA family ATPase [Candidatus Eremiobacteraeota bacterium]|nr:AAA family ATPase [Candidatus Eremiobacteraeota bacterium]